MYEKVLLATDGSDESKLAAKELNKFIQQGLVKELTILTAIISVSDFSHIEIPSSEIDAKIFEAGQRIAAEARELIAGNINITEKVIMGDAPRIICEEAKKEGCDLIVMGSRGRNPISGLMLGSVSIRVLQLASCPVLIVKN